MAAYAALTSLKHIIHDLQDHPFPPISIDKQQVNSLTETVTFLQEFLQCYNSHLTYNEQLDPLKTRIADIAYATEDIIESKIVDQICSQSTVPGNITGNDLYQDLQLVIEEMGLIKKVVMTIHTNSTSAQPQLRRNVSRVGGSSTSSSSSSSSSSSLSTRQKDAMVGCDDVLNEVLESLMASQLNLQIIAITGMGGIGKTTLARNIFQNACVKRHFDICAWTTISQDYNERQALKELLSQARGLSSDLSGSDLGLELYQYLSGRRYLIIMDDMWSIDVWDKIGRYFPDYKDGSRVIVTTRLSNLASHLNNAFNMKFLDDISSWNLFSQTVFGEQNFPLQLQEIGKMIVRNCRGLPLSIVTIGGLLAKSKQTREYWVHIEGNLNSIVNSEEGEYCLRILKMSYDHLPVHLKPCFLYMGVFEEDREISVSTLIKLWVSESFLEPSNEKSLETIAEENLKDLVDRNLVLVHKLGSTGNMKLCKIHDLLRDLCMREAEKERFYHVVHEHLPQGINNMRRVVMRGSTSKEVVFKALQSMPQARSIICDYYEIDNRNPIPLNFRLLRTLQAYGVDYFLKYVFELVNLRYLFIGAIEEFQLTSSFNLLWNLHTLISDECVTVPTEIWSMPHLRHVKFSLGVCMPDPPTGHIVIMKHLQTLKTIFNFKLNHEVVKRIPNIKKLVLAYRGIETNDDHYCLYNLECLHKLETFLCFNYGEKVHDFLKRLTFPKSLKKTILVLSNEFELEKILEKIGSLPLLQKLELRGGFFETHKWKTIEGQFRKLEFLTLLGCRGLEKWTSERSHFPFLKEIYLHYLAELEEIPLEIGDIPTLQVIDLQFCSMSAAVSAKQIVKEQEELLGEGELSFHVRVTMKKEKGEALQRLAGPNFEVINY